MVNILACLLNMVAERLIEREKVDVGFVVDKLVRLLADKRKFPNKQINDCMGKVVRAAFGDEENYPTIPWLVVSEDKSNQGLKTEFIPGGRESYLVVSAGFRCLSEADPDNAKRAIGEFIFQANCWYTSGCAPGGREDWAESRRKAWMDTVEKNPEIIKQLQDLVC